MGTIMGAKMGANVRAKSGRSRRVVAAAGAVASAVAMAAAAAPAGVLGASSVPGGGGDEAIQQIFIDAGYDWTDLDLSDVTVEVGQLIPRSGDFSFLGDAMLGGAELAAEQIRAAGGPNLEFRTEDIGAGDPELSTAGARTLVSDGVPVIQSSFGPATLAVVPIVEQSGTLLFQTAGATADQLNVSDYLWMGRPTATDPFPALADYVIETSPDVERAAMMVWNEGSSIESAKLISSRWEESGREIALDELVAVGETDMGASATRVVGSDAEVVFLIVFGGDTATAINALRDAGFEGTILGVDWNPAVTDATGGSDDGYLYVTDAQDATISDPFAQLYLTNYPERTGAAIDVFSALFWDNTVHIAELVARVVRAGGNPNDSAALIQALIDEPQMPDSSVGTPVGWDVESGAQTLKPHGFYKVTDGASAMIGLVTGGELQLGATLDDAG